MKHILTLICLLLSGLTLAAQPKVQFDQTTKELGTIIWHSPQTATFTFTNKSTSTLFVRTVRTDCGCTVAQWTGTAIEPGGSGTITVTYDAELLGYFSKSLAVYTNIQEEPFYLHIMGQVSMTLTEASGDFPYKIGDYYLNTDNIEFDNVNRGDRPTFSLEIFNASKKSFSPQLMHLPKYLTARAEPETIRPGRTGRVLITLDSNSLPTMGLTQTSIYLSRFAGDRVNKETEINVSATLIPDFLDTPTQQALSPVAQIESTRVDLGSFAGKKKLSTQLLLTNKGKTPLIISALQVYNPGISASINKTRIDPGESEKLKISVNSNGTAFKGKMSVLLITNDPDNPKIVIDINVQP